MKRHIVAWLLACGFVVAGVVVAGCEPETPQDSGRQICVEEGKTREC